MIKLNNKNITYVALADSNNSLKAPKEIWYADSNNSVKLVYRRKDALIDGEDYEKYHWLVAKVDTKATMCTLPTDSNVIEFKSKIIRGRNFHYFGTKGNYIYFCSAGLRKAIYDRNIPTTIYESSIIPLSEEMVISCNDSKILMGSNELPIYGYPITSVRISVSDSEGMETLTSSVTVGGTKRYIPCKLLKPVPKWLDANGIRRQVGECGMIDLVSGKFYGNVNSVGTFTVENYYERKEWLVGDGSAYINTKVTSYTGTISTKYNFIESEIINNESAILGRERVDYTIADFSSRLVFLLIKSSGRLAFQGSDTNASFIQYLTTDTINVDVVNNTFTTSTQSGSVNIGDNVVGRNLYLFATNSGPTAVKRFNGKIAYLKIPNKLNLIPCTLTMDLPASMDANNIARTKGTSGMWDLVSDKFYGNVANSGTFKAVNLAEGVDYEVHHWLKGDGSAYIDTLISDLTNVNDVICYFSSKGVLVDNRIFGREMSGSWFTVGADMNNNSRLSVWIGNSLQYPSIDPNEDFIEIDLINNIARTSLQSYNFNAPASIGRTFYLFGNNGYNIPFVGKIKQFTIGDILNLIPCKLLRSIPPRHDANGIARNAGECGMYDTVNDVFYGNVASSGTFSVSDDS